MKAHIPAFYRLTPIEQQTVVDLANEMGKNIGEQYAEKHFDKIIKIVLCAMNRSLGIGEERGNRFIDDLRVACNEYEAWTIDGVEDVKLEQSFRQIYPNGIDLSKGERKQ